MSQNEGIQLSKLLGVDTQSGNLLINRLPFYINKVVKRNDRKSNNSGLPQDPANR